MQRPHSRQRPPELSDLFEEVDLSEGRRNRQYTLFKEEKARKKSEAKAKKRREEDLPVRYLPVNPRAVDKLANLAGVNHIPIAAPPDLQDGVASVLPQAELAQADRVGRRST